MYMRVGYKNKRREFASYITIRSYFCFQETGKKRRTTHTCGLDRDISQSGGGVRTILYLNEADKVIVER